MKKNRITVVLLISVTFLLTLSCFLVSTPRGPLKFDPDTLPGAQVGVPYDVKLTVVQNATPVGQFSLIEGGLPRGLTLEKVQSENSARISGTPEETGSFTFKIFVWCYGTNVNGQSGEMSYTILVGK
jgi:hypothetical protein